MAAQHPVEFRVAPTTPAPKLSLYKSILSILSIFLEVLSSKTLSMVKVKAALPVLGT